MKECLSPRSLQQPPSWGLYRHWHFFAYFNTSRKLVPWKPPPCSRQKRDTVLGTIPPPPKPRPLILFTTFFASHTESFGSVTEDTATHTWQCSTQCQIVTWCTPCCTKATNPAFPPSIVWTPLASTDPHKPGVTCRFPRSFSRFYTSISLVVRAVVRRTRIPQTFLSLMYRAHTNSSFLLACSWTSGSLPLIFPYFAARYLGWSQEF